MLDVFFPILAFLVVLAGATVLSCLPEYGNSYLYSSTL